MPVRSPNPNCLIQRLRSGLAEQRARDRHRADVRRALEDLRDGHRLRPTQLCVVDHAVGDLDRVRQRELRLRRDEALGERARDRHDLEDGSRLEDVADGGVALQALRRDLVRVVARLHRHREHAAGLRVEHDRGCALRMPLRDGRAQDLLCVRLDRVIERQERSLAVARGHVALDRDRPADRIAHDRLAARRAGELRVELELEPGEALVVDAGVAEHLRRERTLRIRAALLAVEVEARELLPCERARELR